MKGTLFKPLYFSSKEIENAEDGEALEIGFNDPRLDNFGATIVSFKELDFEMKMKQQDFGNKIQFFNENDYLIHRLFNHVFEGK